jgi:pimeloyl-ACP methyl ester carboxylesterase
MAAGKRPARGGAAAKAAAPSSPVALVAKRAAQGLLLAAVLAAVLPWDPTITPGPMSVGPPPPSPDVLRPVRASDAQGYTREIVRFPCGPAAAAATLGRPAAPSAADADLQCEAWLYLPAPQGGDDGSSAAATPPSPAILMAHGMGGQRDMGLDRFAQHLCRGARAAVLAFDYRTFGGSEGEPRNWASPSRHVEDWASAWAHVSSGGLGPRVDASRIALWGTSFAGGHALVLAAKLGDRVRAVVSLVPHLSGPAAARASIARRGLLQSIRMISAGLHDRMREALGLPAAYLPLVGPPGSTALMQLDGHETREYFSKHPEVYHGGWRNLVRARLTLEMGRYSPIDHLPRVRAPVLMIAATNDTLCPIAAVRRAPEASARVRLLLRDCTHFELYRGANFDAVIDAQVALMRAALQGEGDGLAAWEEREGPYWTPAGGGKKGGGGGGGGGKDEL